MKISVICLLFLTCASKIGFTQEYMKLEPLFKLKDGWEINGYSPDGKYVVVNKSNDYKLININNGEKIVDLSWKYVFSADSRFIAHGTEKINIFDITNSAEYQSPPVENSHQENIAIDPDRKFLAYHVVTNDYEDFRIGIWDFVNGKMKKEINLKATKLDGKVLIYTRSYFFFTPDGRYLFAFLKRTDYGGGVDRGWSLVVFSTDNWKTYATLDWGNVIEDNPKPIFFSEDGSIMVFSTQLSIHFYSFAENKFFNSIRVANFKETSGKYFRSNNYYAISITSKALAVLNPSNPSNVDVHALLSGSKLYTILCNFDTSGGGANYFINPVFSFSFSRDGNLLAIQGWKFNSDSTKALNDRNRYAYMNSPYRGNYEYKDGRYYNRLQSIYKVADGKLITHIRSTEIDDESIGSQPEWFDDSAILNGQYICNKGELYSIKNGKNLQQVDWRWYTFPNDRVAVESNYKHNGHYLQLYRASYSDHHELSLMLDKPNFQQSFSMMSGAEVKEKELKKALKNPEVTDLDLHGQNISKIGKEIGNLTNLRHLYLNLNRLKRLPDEVGNLRELQYLNLSYNSLSELPASIGNLHKLRVLYLSGNPISNSELLKLKGVLPNTDVVYIPVDYFSNAIPSPLTDADEEAISALKAKPAQLFKEDEYGLSSYSEIGRIFEEYGDFERAFRAYYMGMSMGSGGDAYALGNLIELHSNLKEHKDKVSAALPYFNKACSLGFEDGCTAAKNSREHLQSVTKHEERMRQMWKDFSLEATSTLSQIAVTVVTKGTNQQTINQSAASAGNEGSTDCSTCDNDPTYLRLKKEAESCLSCSYCAAVRLLQCYIEKGCYKEAGANTSVTLQELKRRIEENRNNAKKMGNICN